MSELDFLNSRMFASVYPPLGDDERFQRPGEDEWREIRGRVKVTGSDEVSVVLNDVQALMMVFELRRVDYDKVVASRALELIAAREEEERGELQTVPPKGFEEAAEALDKARMDARGMLMMAWSMMRDELAGL